MAAPSSSVTETKADYQPAIYVLDAANGFEEQLLEEWLANGQSPQTSRSQSVAVTILQSGAPERLSEELGGPPNTLVSPVRVVWQPDDKDNDAPRIRDLLFGDRRRPGKHRAKRIWRNHPERVIYVEGQDATISELRERFARTAAVAEQDDPHGFAKFVQRQASLTLDIAERGLRGSRYKVPRFVAENLQANSKFNASIDALAAELGKSSQELMREAEGYMQEMVARPSTFWLDVSGALNRFILAQGYDAEIVCDQGNIENARKLVRENPSVILWTHKSHVDGFAMNSVFFDNDFPAPHILGGVNMAFAGLGFLARRSVGIFIRRTFKDNPLYKLVLRHYLGYLMEKRFSLSWAFEGTRSRVGKLMPPRYGLLKYVLDAARETDARNLHILPVTISYDLITDVADYAAEQTGTKKKAESLSWFLSYIGRLRQPLGRVYLNFGEPVVLAKAPPEDDPLELPKIAFQVAVNANAATPITVPSLVSMVLLGVTPQALTTGELRVEVIALIEWAKRRGIRMTSDFDLENADHLRAIASNMINSGLVTRYAEGPESVYGIAPEQQLHASYYRNTVIHYFVNKSIAELALARAGEVNVGSTTEVFWKEVERLRDLLKFEFFYSPLTRFKEELQQELHEIDPNWELALVAGGASASQMLSTAKPLVAHAALLHFVEAYSVVADLLAGIPSGQTLDEKDCVVRAMKYAKQSYLQRRISSEASISELLFRNAYQLMDNQDLTAGGDDSVSVKRKSMALELRDLLARLNRIRALAVTIPGKDLQTKVATGKTDATA